jgi:hypothetical protein
MAEAIGVSFKRNSLKTDLSISFNDDEHLFFCCRTIMRQGNYSPLKHLYRPETSKAFLLLSGA